MIYVGLLAISYTLVARAIALPATAARPAAVGAGAMAPMAAAVAGVLAGAPPSPMPNAASFVDALTWMVAAVAMSAVASRVIFGLQAEVAETRRWASTHWTRRSARVAWAWCTALTTHCTTRWSFSTASTSALVARDGPLPPGRVIHNPAAGLRRPGRGARRQAGPP